MMGKDRAFMMAVPDQFLMGGPVVLLGTYDQRKKDKSLTKDRLKTVLRFQNF